MPQMANITVKNAANEDVVYNGIVSSAGDRSPARWTAISASSIAGHRPTLSVLTRDNGNKNGRVMEVSFRFPIVTTGTDGRPQLTAIVPFQVHGTLPTNVDATLVQDAFVQCMALLNSDLFKEMAANGYAPT